MQTLNHDVPQMGSKVTATSARVKAAKKSAKKLNTAKLRPVHIIFVLDRSSSMNSMKEEAISGFNTFLSSQQELPGKATFSLVFFDTEVILVYDNTDIKKIPALDVFTYKPNGMTALYDAIGYTVDRYKGYKAEKTIMAILTDGAENASSRYDASSVHQILKNVQSEGEWEVLFLGANLDTRGFVQSVGIKLNNSTSYDYTKKGMHDSMVSASYATSAMRGASFNVGGETMDAFNLDMSKIYDFVKNGTQVTASTTR